MVQMRNPPPPCEHERAYKRKIHDKALTIVHSFVCELDCAITRLETYAEYAIIDPPKDLEEEVRYILRTDYGLKMRRLFFKTLRRCWYGSNVVVYKIYW